MAEAATGVKISGLVQAEYILPSAKFEIVQEGDNFKVPYSLVIASLLELPRFSLVQDVADYTETPLTVSTITSLLATATLEELKTLGFELVSNTRLKYINEESILFNLSCELGGVKASGTGSQNNNFYVYRNSLQYGGALASGLSDGVNGTVNINRQIHLSQNDEIEVNIENETNNDDYGLLTLNFNGHTIKPEEFFLDAELFENPDLTTLDGFTDTSSISFTLSDDGIIAERSGGALSQFTITITGCTVSARHRLELHFKRGVSGTSQDFYVQNAFNVVTTAIEAGDSQSFVFDFIALTATVQIIVTAGALGESVEIVAPLSCRKYL